MIGALYSEWKVKSLSNVTCPPIFMQFTGCDQPLQHSYWPENAIDRLTEIMLITCVMRHARTHKLQ